MAKKFSKEWKDKIRNSLKGRKLSDETKAKMSKFQKANPNSGVYKPGNSPWISGRKHSEVTVKKMSEVKLGVKQSKEQVDARVKSQTGIRRSQETKKKLSISKVGSKNPQWRGGHTIKYAVDWTRELRISIRERDRYTCFTCGEKQGDRAHSVHHIDYDKNNCNPTNLITLCASCHVMTNSNRDYWLRYFKQNG